MKNARRIGNNIQNLSEKNNVSISELSNVLLCTENQVKLLFTGRALASYSQLQKLSELLNVPVSQIIQENEQVDENKEFVLDIIDDYIDIKESL